MSLVIAAIPDEMQYVWQISSEKIPHMTVLHLGDVTDEATIKHVIETTVHASDVMLLRFSLSVDRRGTLGEDEADVLFFEKDHLCDKVEAFRHALLQDATIRTLYDSVEQYPEWTPHLTLGYPDKPAKKDDREYPFYYINFDRLDVWTGDFEGPSFLLKREDDTVSMTELGRDFLEHHGVKGMRWGVRRSQATLDKAAGRDEGGKSSGSDDAPNAGRSGGSGSGSGDSGTNSRSPQKSVAEMNDKELKAYVNRLQMEQQFARMQPTPLSKKAAKFAGEVLVGVARQQLTNALNAQVSAALGTDGALRKAGRDLASTKATRRADKAGVPRAPGPPVKANPFLSGPSASDRRDN